MPEPGTAIAQTGKISPEIILHRENMWISDNQGWKCTLNIALPLKMYIIYFFRNVAMRLNLQTDYALRLLMHLAVNDGALVTITEVAERYGISKNHLMKVAHLLSKEGIIHTVRGRSGGLRLGLPSGDINLGKVVRLMEADLALVECFQEGEDRCAIAPACRLKNVFNQVLDAFLAVLDQYTLEHLVSRNKALRSLLLEGAA